MTSIQLQERRPADRKTDWVNTEVQVKGVLVVVSEDFVKTRNQLRIKSNGRSTNSDYR